MYIANDQWTEVLELLKKKMSAPSFETWLKSTTAKIENHTWFVVASNEFSRDWLESRYLSDIKHAISQLTGGLADVKIIVDHQPEVHLYAGEVEKILEQIKSLSSSERVRLFSSLKNVYEHELQLTSSEEAHGKNNMEKKVCFEGKGTDVTTKAEDRYLYLENEIKEIKKVLRKLEMKVNGEVEGN